MMNKFKRFNLVDRVPEELWTEAHNIVQEAMTITIPKRRKCKKAKQLSERVLQIADERRKVKSKGEKDIYNHLNAKFQRIPEEIRKPSSVINAKKQRKTTEWERLEISSRKLEIPREYFMQRWAQ